MRVGLGCDGAVSNDNSDLMRCVHSAYLLQALVARTRADPVPLPSAFLRYATEGGASLLGRGDLGRLAPGMAANLFAVDTRRLDFVGTRHDPQSLLAKVDLGQPVDLTVINGRVAWARGEFPGLDEARLAAEAALHRTLAQ